MKILLLEDDEIISEQIVDYFELSGHRVDSFDNGATLLDCVEPSVYDILLLDINTPGQSGLEVLREIREGSVDTPAIFITAMSSMEYLKNAYDIGCDDYIRKPFDIEELEIRIEHLAKGKNSKVIAITPSYRFDMSEEKLYHNDKVVELNEKESSLVYILLKNSCSVVSKEVIISYVWDEQDICNNTLRTTIKKLRAKLKENFIQSQRGIGYRIEIKS